MGADLASNGDRTRDRVVPSDCEYNELAMGTDPCYQLYSLQPNMPSNADVLQSIGISSEEFFLIVQQMGDLGTLPENTLTLF